MKIEDMSKKDMLLWEIRDCKRYIRELTSGKLNEEMNSGEVTERIKKTKEELANFIEKLREEEK